MAESPEIQVCMPRDGSKYSAGWAGRECARGCHRCVRTTLPALRRRPSPPPPTSPLREAAAGGRAGLPGLGAPAKTRITQPLPSRMSGCQGVGRHRAMASVEPGGGGHLVRALFNHKGLLRGRGNAAPLSACTRSGVRAACRLWNLTPRLPLQGKGNEAPEISTAARICQLSKLVFPCSPKAEQASTQRAELKNAYQSPSRPQQLN